MSLAMMQQLHRTLSEHRAPGLREIAAEMDRLWLHPDEFEHPGSDLEWEDLRGESYIANEHVFLVFHLGVCFGIDYERQYPTDEDEDWPEPVPVQEAEAR